MSVTIKLPDESTLNYDSPVTALKVAEDISPRLADAAVAAEVDGRLVDLTTELSDGEHSLRLLTNRDEEALEVLRHTAAHILAQAVVRLYGSDVQYTIGPALTDDFQYGFYYDFDLPEKISTEDLPKIEAEMRKIVDEDLPIARVELSVDEAKQRLQRQNQRYKAEMIDDLVRDERVDTVSLYEQGDFLDMCRGPHLPSTGKLPAFKLLSVAGAYWRGDVNKQMLTRIYGTAFFDEKSLKRHIERIEEARKRDNRVLGRQLGLFFIDEKVGPGLPMWLPKGNVIREELQNWLKGELVKRGYQLVSTPHIGKLELYRISGHYPYYQDSQYPPIPMGDEEGYLLKPMNCPHHMRILKVQQLSYRDLPVRLAEFGTVYRMEQSGELNGLIRVRGFTQDDAHIICTPEQLESELASCVELTQLVLNTLGLNDYRVRVGLRETESDKYVGDADNWTLAENNIRQVVGKLGMNYSEESGEAAFYGPKIDFVVTDCLGRQWQLGTIQVDYNIPERFELEYTGADNAQHRPVMIHRAPFGSLERFIGILIEHYAGAFPLWLAPVQVSVLPVSEKVADYAETVAARLREAGIRVELDYSADKVGAKIRRASMQKVPYMAVVGPREAEDESVSVRVRGEGDQGTRRLDEFVKSLTEEIDSKKQNVVTGVQD